MVDETTLAILQRQGGWGITILGSQRKIGFDIQVDPKWPKWPTKRSKLAAKDFEISDFHHDTWNRYLIFRFGSAHIAWNGLSILVLRWSYKVLHSKLVLPSAGKLSDLRRRQSALTVDAIKKQLPSRNKVNSAWDGGTSQIKLASTLAIAYYMERNWALCAVLLAFDEVDRLVYSRFES